MRRSAGDEMVACLTGLFCHPSEHAEPIDIHFIKNTKGGK
jgi:hypothetical protein